MKSKLLAAAVIAAFAATGTTGAIAAGDKQQDVQGVGTPQPKKQPFAKLDTDKDGFLGHSEAAADRDAASRFHELDQDKDQKVSRSEYDAWDKAGSAATGATGSKSAKDK